MKRKNLVTSEAVLNIHILYVSDLKKAMNVYECCCIHPLPICTILTNLFNLNVLLHNSVLGRATSNILNQMKPILSSIFFVTSPHSAHSGDRYWQMVRALPRIMFSQSTLSWLNAWHTQKEYQVADKTKCKCIYSASEYILLRISFWYV